MRMAVGLDELLEAAKGMWVTSMEMTPIHKRAEVEGPAPAEEMKMVITLRDREENHWTLFLQAGLISVPRGSTGVAIAPVLTFQAMKATPGSGGPL